MKRLLEPDEPAPVTVERIAGKSPILLTCDHASNRIPRALGTLGLADFELRRHIAWDIGAAGLSRFLSLALDATLVLQNYSRLVIDCNRPHDNPDLVPLKSEATEVPGNHGIDEGALAQRRDEIFEPYHGAITEQLERRAARPNALVAIHSFTPVYHGRSRPWHIGVLYGSDRRMAGSMLRHFDEHGQWCVGDNEPYRIDHKDYGIPVHGEARRIPHVLLEIRQDLIESESGQRYWAAQLARPLHDAFAAAADGDAVGLL